MRSGCVVLLLALGCDPMGGVTDSAEAAAPDVKRYFDGAGTRVADGPWNRVVVDLDPDTLYHVGARRLDDSEPTFHLFGADTRNGCSVAPNVGTWLMGKPEGAPYRLLPYLESSDENGRGRLRFTSLDCEVQDIAVEDAAPPETDPYDDGYLVSVGTGYTLVDPWRGTVREIAKHISARLIWQDAILLWADDKLKSFSYELEEGEQTGDQVTTVLPIVATKAVSATNPFLDVFLVEDALGLHRVTFDRASLALPSVDVLPDACHVHWGGGTQDGNGAWLVMELPCGSPASMVHVDHELNVLEQLALPERASPEATRVVVTLSDEGEPQLVATLFLTDIEQDLGTLWALPADAETPIKLAEHASLNVVLDSIDSEWDGIAYANHQEIAGVLTYDWLHFRWNGEVETFAERLATNATTHQILVNFDGVSGDLPLFMGHSLDIVAEGVPLSGGEATSLIGQHRSAQVDHFDGETGRLVLSERGDDLRDWQELATGVSPNSLRFSWFMPALLFLENWDSEREVGSLVAYNYELDARTTIAHGVSSFDLTNYPWDGVIYAVPYGSKKGLWFSKAK